MIILNTAVMLEFYKMKYDLVLISVRSWTEGMWKV